LRKSFLFIFIILSSCLSSNQDENLIDVIESEPNYDSLRVELEKMYDLDQNVRQKLNSSGGFNGEINNEMFINDSINQSKLKKILDSYGWLPSSAIGEKASDAIFYIIQHGSDELIDKHLEELQSLAEINEAKKTHAALMEDRMLMHKNQKQIYGTQAYSVRLDDNTWDSFIWPIENPEYVNDRRASMGFEKSIEEIAKENGYRYDPNEPLPKK
jgi:hypothetical protein